MRTNVKVRGNNRGVRSGRSDRSSAVRPFPNCSQGSACQNRSSKVKDLGRGKGTPWPLTLFLHFISLNCQSHVCVIHVSTYIVGSSQSGTFCPPECCFWLKINAYISNMLPRSLPRWKKVMWIKLANMVLYLQSFDNLLMKLMQYGIDFLPVLSSICFFSALTGFLSLLTSNHDTAIFFRVLIFCHSYCFVCTATSAFLVLYYKVTFLHMFVVSPKWLVENYKTWIILTFFQQWPTNCQSSMSDLWICFKWKTTVSYNAVYKPCDLPWCMVDCYFLASHQQLKLKSTMH